MRVVNVKRRQTKSPKNPAKKVVRFVVRVSGQHLTFGQMHEHAKILQDAEKMEEIHTIQFIYQIQKNGSDEWSQVFSRKLEEPPKEETPTPAKKPTKKKTPVK